MWQRFTERARRVVFNAQEEAQKFGEGYVSTEHLLLGLVRESESTGVRALVAVGVDPAKVRQEVEKQLPRGEPKTGQDMTLTPRAKRVIDLAYDEARNLDHNYIGSEHLLLGLVREGDGLAGRVLAKLGANLDSLRQVVMESTGKGETTNISASVVGVFLQRFGMTGPGGAEISVPANNAIWERCTPAARGIVDAAREIAGGRGAFAVGGEHLALALLDAPESRGMRAVAALGADLERARRVAEAMASGSVEGAAPEPLPFSLSGQSVVTGAYIAAAAMGNPFVGTEHLALSLFGGAFGEAVDPEAFDPRWMRSAVARSQAEG